MTRQALFTLVVTAVLAGGCSQVEYIEIEPSSVTLRSRNDGVWLRGKSKSHTGVHYANARVSWSVKDPTIASVDEAGRVKPLKSGTTEAIAAYGKVHASVPVEVVFPAKLVVEPMRLELTESAGPQELTVKIFDAQGRLLKDRTPTFVSRNKEVVSMGQNAAFAVNAGQTQVEVRVDELLQAVEVTVKPQQMAKRK